MISGACLGQYLSATSSFCLLGKGGAVGFILCSGSHGSSRMTWNSSVQTMRMLLSFGVRRHMVHAAPEPSYEAMLALDENNPRRGVKKHILEQLPHVSIHPSRCSLPLLTWHHQNTFSAGRLWNAASCIPLHTLSTSHVMPNTGYDLQFLLQDIGCSILDACSR